MISRESGVSAYAQRSPGHVRFPTRHAPVDDDTTAVRRADVMDLLKDHIVGRTSFGSPDQQDPMNRAGVDEEWKRGIQQ